jgi:hypothetical protein
MGLIRYLTFIYREDIDYYNDINDDDEDDDVLDEDKLFNVPSQSVTNTNNVAATNNCVISLVLHYIHPVLQNFYLGYYISAPTNRNIFAWLTVLTVHMIR